MSLKLSLSEALTEEEIEALRNIAEMIFPYHIDVWQTVRDHMAGYSREKAIERFVEECEKNPTLARLKAISIHAELWKIIKEASKDVSPSPQPGIQP